MQRIFPLSILIIYILSSCFKEDVALKPYDGVITLIPEPIQVNQSYFDFETGRVLTSLPSNTWQLGFECTAEGWHIITNSGGNWFIYNSEQTIQNELVIMPTKVDHLYDVPSAFPDSTAVGNWTTVSPGGNTYTHNIYLLGHYENGKFKDIKEVVFLSVDDTTYSFSYKEELSGLSDTISIIKNDSVGYVYFNFDTKLQVNAEPDRELWDLAFGPYYDMATYFGVTIPYLVGGSFINAGYTEAALDSLNSFDRIDAGMIPDYEFIRQRDIPGYRWKSVTVDVSGGGSATYKVITNYSYIFHTAEDHYYKLKFISYTHNGLSGYPQFEFKKLE
jgi:hypothetical protein